MMRLIIDAHLDIAWNALAFRRDYKEPIQAINEREQELTDSRARGGACVSLPELRRGRVAVCVATIIAAAKRGLQPPNGYRRVQINPDCGTRDMAYAVGQGQLAYYRLLEQQGEMVQLRTARDLNAHWHQWQEPQLQRHPIGYILAMEGADPIVEPSQIEGWWNDGLRCVILNHYGQGYYSDGTGGSGGLTSTGRELLREMRRLEMILDVTHTTDRSFYESMDLFDGGVMASHTNCRALVPGVRQFSDEQIALLIQRRAVIGVALDAWMLRPGWVIGESQPTGLSLANVVDHIDHICQLAGNADHVAIGSDLDGGFGGEQRPEDIESVADLQKLAPLMAARGYTESDINRVFHGNWLQFFLRSLPANESR
jgi:membrane dipeptidase